MAGRWEILALALNGVVGSGVYLLPAAAAAELGAASLWAVGAAGLAVALIVLCFAEAASHFDQAGGAYLYARAAFGDLIGFEVGWMTWLARVVSLASLSAGFAQALVHVWPGASSGAGRALAVSAPLLALTAINVVGVRSGVRTAAALVVAKLAPLALFVGAGLPAVDGSVVRAQPPGAGGWGEAALLILFAYGGFENTSAPAGEFRNPRRDIPLALLLEVAIVTVLYLGVQWVALGTLPGLRSSATPLADAASGFLGPWAGWVLTAGAAVAILGTNANTVLAGPRYLFALARDGFGPAALAAVHPRFRTPHAAILLQTVIGLPLALSGTFTGLAALSVVARLVTYLGTAASVLVLRRRHAGQRGFRLPGGPLVPAAALVVSLAFVASATGADLLAAGVALLVGYGVYRRSPRVRSGSSNAV